MFRSYEFSLAMRRSEVSCPAQSPKPVPPNVTSPGGLGTQYISLREISLTFVE